MIITNLVKLFELVEENRARIDLSGGLRLNPGNPVVEESRLELPRQAAPNQHLYDTSTTLSALTWLTTPLSVKSWKGFEAVITDAADPDGGGAIVTSAGYRLDDGTDEFWWDGGAWVSAASTDWNTEEEVAANIAAFSVSERALRVVVNLRTSDARVTPKLVEIKVLYGAVIDHQEDYLIRSLIPALKAGVRPAGRTLIAFSGGTTLLLSNYVTETPYNIVDIDSVFDNVADPNHQTDLLDNYNTTTKVITLASDPGSTDLFIRFLYQPVVALDTSRDYREVGAIPSLTIEGVRIVGAAVRGTDDSVVNKAAGTAVVVLAPRQGDIEFDLVADTDKIVDQHRLAEEARAYLSRVNFLRSVGMDENFRLWVLSDYEATGAPNGADLRTGKLRARIVGAVFFERGSNESASAVKTFQTSPDSNLQISTP